MVIQDSVPGRAFVPKGMQEMRKVFCDSFE
jgi:hypothetical protein